MINNGWIQKKNNNHQKGIPNQRDVAHFVVRECCHHHEAMRSPTSASLGAAVAHPYQPHEVSAHVESERLQRPLSGSPASASMASARSKTFQNRTVKGFSVVCCIRFCQNDSYKVKKIIIWVWVICSAMMCDGLIGMMAMLEQLESQRLARISSEKPPTVRSHEQNILSKCKHYNHYTHSCPPPLMERLILSNQWILRLMPPLEPP